MKLPTILAAMLLLIPACLTAQDDNTTGCIISSKKTSIRIDGDRRILTDSVEMIVLDRRGERFTSFSFPYTKGDKFSIDYAHISDAQGNILRKLKNGDIRQSQYTPDGEGFYNDEFVKYFDLRHNTYPYRVSYAVSRTTRRFLSVGYLAPGGQRSIADGRFSIEVPAGFPLKILSRNLDEPVKQSSTDTDIYTWRYTYDPQKPEMNASPDSDTSPVLEVLPERFHYGVSGSYDSWESFGNWAWALNDGLDKLPASEQARIDELLDGVDDTREKVRILYHYLQDYNRYINVRIDLGGYKSYPAEYVCLNRFGDCKALCNYMRAILKYAGIESYYTLTFLDEQVPRFDEDFPSNAFNHIIVTVPLPGETLFLDCTSKNLPFGYCGTANQGRRALVTKHTGSHLTDVPAMSAAQTACVYDFKVTCPDDRSSSVNLSAMLRGREFEFFTSLSAGANRNDAEIYLRNHAFGSAMQMSGYGIDRPHRDSTFVELRVEGTHPGMYRIFGGTMVLDNIALALPVYELPGQRTSGVQIDVPRNDLTRIEYRFDGLALGAMPEDIAISSPYGRYRVAFDRPEPGCMTVTKKLEIAAGHIPPEQYPEFYDFVSRVRNNEHLKFQIPIR